MRTHTKTFHIRLTEEEYERLCKYSERAGLPKSTYIRFMINGQSPKDHPPMDYFKMAKELHYIGHNLNQLATLAHRFGSLRTKKLDETIADFNKKYIEIVDTVMVPTLHNKAELAAILEQGRLQAEKDKEEIV